jgi:hypothetical protein
MNPEHLIIIGAVLATTGGAMVWASTAPSRRRRKLSTQPPHGGSPGALPCAALGGGAIAGLQWMLLNPTVSAPVSAAMLSAWAVVLGLPAFLAGATLVRLAGVVHAALNRRRRRREIRRARCERR